MSSSDQTIAAGNTAPAESQPQQRDEVLAILRSPRAWWAVVIAGALALVLGLGTLSLVGTFARAMALLLLGIVLAEALAPLANGLSRVMPRIVAVLLLYLIAALLFGALMWLAIPILVNQLSAFIAAAPGMLESIQGWLEARGLPSGPDIRPNDGLLSTLLSQFGALLGGILRVPVGIAGVLAEAGLVLFVSIYWQIEKPGWRRAFLSLLPNDSRKKAAGVTTKMGGAMGGYVRGIVIEASLVGVLMAVGLWIIGIPYPVLLGALAMMLEVVPMLGPIVAAVPAIALGLAQSLETALITLAFIIVLQQFEAEVLLPLIMRGQTRVSPMTAIVAVFAGAAAGGFLGIFVAIPLVAGLRVVIREVLAPTIRRWMGVTPVHPEAMEERVEAKRKANGAAEDGMSNQKD